MVGFRSIGCRRSILPRQRMSSSTWVTPPPFFRHVARRACPHHRVVPIGALDQQKSERLQRLLHMKENVIERLQSLQATSGAEQNTSKSTEAGESSTGQLSPRQAPAKSSSSSAQSNSKATRLSKPTVILRHDVYLPWKHQNITVSQNPPIEVILHHIDAFTKDGSDIPASISHIEQFPQKSANLQPGSAQVAEHILSGLNERQREAVVADITQACLVLAGPGSGKTRVLTHRIAYLIKACGARPYSILAVTFTNKAAAEMRARVDAILKEHSDEEFETSSQLTVGTFHWVGARLLRMYGEHIGIKSDFDICDQQDSKSIISRIINASKKEGETADASEVSMSAALLSKLKNDKENELRQRMPRFIDGLINLRNEYNTRLRAMNLLDFDDLLVETRRMLRECPEVRTILQNRFQHVLVDEWQDTNSVQFDIVTLLTGSRRNLFVVGDVDQSIYKFRGADSGNMQRYTQIFENAQQIMLVRNYRSTGNIITAAQAVIEQDKKRPKKDMVTENTLGEQVHLLSVPDGRVEAQHIVSSILSMRRKSEISSFSECAVMYRTNAQSRLLEEACVQARIPYLLQSGTRFFDRKEVKDLVAYLKVLFHPWDDNAVIRIINVPPRGIGKRTIERIESYAEMNGIGIMTTIESMLANPEICAQANIRSSEIQRVNQFYELVEVLRDDANRIIATSANDDNAHVGAVLSKIAGEIGYEDYLRSIKESDRANKTQDRMDNVEELFTAASKFNEVPMFLERVTLMSEAGAQQTDGDGAIWLTTLHGSKGLEFPAVFIAGAEDGVIPLIRDGTVEDIEEERRLLYVGMTRAMNFLKITWRSQSFSRRGDKAPKMLKMSRFLTKVSGLNVKEIKQENSGRGRYESKRRRK